MSMVRSVKTIVKIAIYLMALLLILVLIPIFAGISNCAVATVAVAPLVQSGNLSTATKDIADFHRPQRRTYSTFPRWYMIFTAQEYADYISTNLPSGFPYYSAIEQYWDGYCSIYRVTTAADRMTVGEHFKNIFSGIIFSIQYTIKGVYENTLGAFTEWYSSDQMVEEDKYAAMVAEEYAQFVPYSHWYQYSFMNSLYGLWWNNHIFGTNFVRKSERKLYLSIGYILKATYAGVVDLYMHVVPHKIHDQNTYVLIKNASASIFTATYKNNAKITMIKKLGPQEYIAAISHGQSFTDIVPALAQSGVQFENIAGNHSILVTAVTPPGWSFELSQGKILFSMDMLAQPDSKRIVIQVPVTQLSSLLQQLNSSGALVEHVYDY